MGMPKPKNGAARNKDLAWSTVHKAPAAVCTIREYTTHFAASRSHIPFTVYLHLVVSKLGVPFQICEAGSSDKGKHR